MNKCRNFERGNVWNVCGAWCVSCWCVTRRGRPVVGSKAKARFYYKKDGVRLRCVDVPAGRGERPPVLPSTAGPPPPPRSYRPVGSPFGPPVNDEGPVVVGKGQAAAADIPVHFQILEWNIHHLISSEMNWTQPPILSSLQGAPIKNNPLEKMLYFSHGSMDLSQTFRLLYEYLHKISCKFYWNNLDSSSDTTV